MNNSRFLILLMLICFNTKAQRTQLDNETYVIKNVNIIPMTENDSVIKGANVVIENNEIHSINGAIPSNAIVIQGKDKWLIPGLVDMHVHSLADINFSSNYPTKGASHYFNGQDVMVPYIVNGVTTILEMAGRPEHFGLRNQINSGDITGPRMALSKLLNGGDGAGQVNGAEFGRQAVRSAKADGYSFIKVYSDLDKTTFNAIVDEAEKQNMKVLGHIPYSFEDNLEEALNSNLSLVAHAEEFAKQSKNFDKKDAEYFAELAKQYDLWLSPTLIVMERMADQTVSLDSVRNLEGLEYVHPMMQNKWLTSNNNFKNTSPEKTEYFRKLARFNKLLTQVFADNNIPILAGTDAGSSGVIWGYSLHDELEFLSEAGLSPMKVLESATILPAQWLGISDKIGSIEEGKLADLVLLERNPLENIKNTRTIEGVFFDGRWIDKSKIKDLLEDLAEDNAKRMGKDRYRWDKRRNY